MRPQLDAQRGLRALPPQTHRSRLYETARSPSFPWTISVAEKTPSTRSYFVGSDSNRAKTGKVSQCEGGFTGVST
jgi:hypothetical protein